MGAPSGGNQSGGIAMTPQRSGFTLIELLVVIALVVLVSMERSGGGGTGSSPLLPVDCLYVFCI